MNKIWKPLSLILIGAIAGILVYAKWFSDCESVSIGKIKVKGRNNTQDTELNYTNTNKHEKDKEKHR